MTQDMNCSKTVARQKEGSRKTLAILFEYAWSMPRVCLEYAKSMARVWLEAKPSAHVGNKTSLRLTLDEILASLRWQASRARATARASRHSCVPAVASEQSSSDVSSSTRFLRPFSSKRAKLERRLVVTLFLTMFWGVNTAWGQGSYEGTWYITNGSSYYLCPAGASYQNNYDKPYLTTFKTNKDKNSIWRIVKVEDGTDTYYRFIHNATGKYLTANDVVDSDNPAYLRLHLESFETPTDATLFIIVKHTNNKLAIRSKDYNDAANGHYWLDISEGNKGNYWNGNYQGSLGFWYDNPIDQNNAAPWTLQEATPTCATPIIIYNEAGNTFSISYPISSDGATIHYTTDGTEPTASSATYSGVISGASVTTKLRAIAVATGYTNSEEAMVYGSTYFATPHLFKTIDAANQSYYLISPTDDADDNADRQYLTTSNVPNPRMQWLIKPASCNSGIQYYYLVNSETGKYVYFTGTGMNQTKVFVLKSRNEEGVEADRFMFRIWEGVAEEISYFNFSPKMIAYALPAQSQNNMLYKQNATDNANPTGVIKDNTNGLPRWHMVDVPADPKSLSALPAEMISTENNKVYFKLRNAMQTNSEDYFVYPPSVSTYATAATTGSNPEWYLFPANDEDTWNTYYYIRNAETGNYLYFDGTTKYDNNNNKFLVGSVIASGDEDKYKFLILKTANTTYSGTYHIVPKTMRNNNNQANIALNRNSATLRTYQSRGNATSCWYLDATTFKCAVPTFQYASGKLNITCSTDGAAIYYALGSTPPTISEANRYTGPITLPDGSSTVTALAVRNSDASDKSDAASFTMEIISSGDEITNMSGYYTLGSNFTPSTNPIGTADNPFRGTIDGQLNAFSISHPLFAYVENAVIKNVILDNVNISSGISSGDDAGNTGAIACVAKGTTRIYNCGVKATNSTVSTDDDGYTEITSCSSTISGSGYVGSIVGLLDGSSRVINCFSYAKITGGSYVGGIVGWNKVATTSVTENQKTMVMNCMFYGDIDIDKTTNRAPIYNGEIITNRSDQSGVSNFNYFWAGASYVQSQKISTYNCALVAETRYLQRFEFFRPLLNSNRALAAWWAIGNRDKKDEMMKWVMEPSQIGTSTPYPILKAPYDSNNKIIKYSSVVNLDADHAEAFSTNAATAKTQYNQGRKFDTTFTINIENASSDAPSGASITTSKVYPNITDKDPKHFNFNYYKVQLPYYNDVGTKNYTQNKVVTGWEVTVSGGTKSFSTSSSDATAGVSANGDITLTTPYNFADRKCTEKDNYATNGHRIFNQGAYFDVPEGVTSITIKPHWGKCVYVADEYLDVVYKKDMTGQTSVTTIGGGKRYPSTSFTKDGSTQTVYTSMSAAVTALNPSGTVYDNAIVLVGNVHSLDISNKESNKPYTIMSIDLDKDNEPDYSYILRFDSRKRVHPVRIDFLNVIGLGMAQKSHEGTGTYNFGIMQPYGWFEVTNTGLFRVTQFEYDVKVSASDVKAESPIILQGGVIEQWVTYQNGNHSEAEATQYYHVGGNVWFKEFQIGCHQDRTDKTSRHTPISVTGGEYDEFYLTGYYNSPATNYDDNAECYINGGRFGKVAGTGMQGIGGFTMNGNKKTAYSNGNIVWQIDNADIDEFYAGGINAAHIAEGNITTVISNSRVDQFCGGPKFGDMNSDKKVVTNATNCKFRTFFGAGYGGNSYNRRYPTNQNDVININWDTWVGQQYTKKYDSNYNGVEARIDYQFLPMSGNTKNCARLFVDYVSFSLATTYDVTSKLTGCTITKSPLGRLDLFEQCLGNFYGGGSLGKVTGDVKSTLTNCTVEGNVFGAGYSATVPNVKVMASSFQNQPHYDENLGAYLEATLPSTETYTWEHATTVSSTETAINTGTKKLFTTIDLSKSNLGSVSGAVTLTLTTSGDSGKTIVGTDGDNTTGHVYGGGDASAVNNTTTPTDASTTVNLKGNTKVLGNVYGGGNKGIVSGTATVNIEQ